MKKSRSIPLPPQKRHTFAISLIPLSRIRVKCVSLSYWHEIKVRFYNSCAKILVYLYSLSLNFLFIDFYLDWKADAFINLSSFMQADIFLWMFYKYCQKCELVFRLKHCYFKAVCLHNLFLLDSIAFLPVGLHRCKSQNIDRL